MDVPGMYCMACCVGLYGLESAGAVLYKNLHALLIASCGLGRSFAQYFHDRFRD